MDKKTIIDLVWKIMEEELSVVTEDRSEERSLQEIGLDSIGLMTLIVFVENELGISIEFDEKWPVELTSISLTDFADNILRCVEAK